MWYLLIGIERDSVQRYSKTHNIVYSDENLFFSANLVPYYYYYFLYRRGEDQRHHSAISDDFALGYFVVAHCRWCQPELFFLWESLCYFWYIFQLQEVFWNQSRSPARYHCLFLICTCVKYQKMVWYTFPLYFYLEHELWLCIFQKYFFRFDWSLEGIICWGSIKTSILPVLNWNIKKFIKIAFWEKPRAASKLRGYAFIP